MTVRFVVLDHGIRDTKDAMSRDLLKELEAAGIKLASTTFEVTALPDLRIETTKPEAALIDGKRKNN